MVYSVTAIITSRW